jgi:chromate reductase
MSKFIILLSSQKQNLELANSIKNEILAQGSDAEIIDLVALGLPLYSSKAQNELGIPSEIDTLFNQCINARGFVIVAPEYNGGVPPVLTNAMAWLSVHGKEWRDAFNAKIAGLATFSGGPAFNLLAILRIQMAHIGCTILGRALQVNHSKPLNRDSLVDFVHQLIKQS